jgi:hypothetical protein
LYWYVVFSLERELGYAIATVLLVRIRVEGELTHPLNFWGYHIFVRATHSIIQEASMIENV